MVVLILQMLVICAQVRAWDPERNLPLCLAAVPVNVCISFKLSILEYAKPTEKAFLSRRLW